MLFLNQFVVAQAPIGVTQIPPIEYSIVDVRPQFKGGINEFFKIYF